MRSCWICASRSGLTALEVERAPPAKPPNPAEPGGEEEKVEEGLDPLPPAEEVVVVEEEFADAVERLASNSFLEASSSANLMISSCSLVGTFRDDMARDKLTGPRGKNYRYVPNLKINKFVMLY